MDGSVFAACVNGPLFRIFKEMEAPFTAEQQAQHIQSQFLCLAAAEIRQGTEHGTFHLHILELFGQTKWCPTPDCLNKEVVSLKFIGSPQIIHDYSGRENDLMLYAYEGYCPKCRAPRSGGFGYYSNGNKDFTTPGTGWLFNAARLVARS